MLAALLPSAAIILAFSVPASQEMGPHERVVTAQADHQPGFVTRTSARSDFSDWNVREPQRSSHLARAEPGVFSSLIFLGVTFLMGLTLWLMRKKPLDQLPASERVPRFPRAAELDIAPEEGPRLKTGTFLAEIREREQQIEEGVEQITPRRPPLIPLAKESIRVIDEDSE